MCLAQICLVLVKKCFEFLDMPGIMILYVQIQADRHGVSSRCSFII